MGKLTPMMEQYMSIKEEHADKIIFFQVGDFYELFFDDARVASHELDLVLTTRDTDKKDPVPMAGIPIHAIDNYLPRMIEKGHKVAICDQTEEPSTAGGGLVKREVTRIVTPGTVIDESMLRNNHNNYLLSLLKDTDNYYGLAITDISTGGFWATEVSGENAEDLIRAEWQRLVPAEVICTSWMMEDRIVSECRKIYEKTLLEEVPDSYFSHREAQEAVLAQWGSKQIKKTRLHKYPLAISASGALLTYLQTLQKTSLKHLKTLELYFPGEYMVLDGVTRRNLELTQTIREGKRKGSLIGVLDYTCNSMGGRLLKSWLEQPLRDVTAIGERIEAVDEIYNQSSLKADLGKQLARIFDLERFCSRVNFGATNARDLAALKETLWRLPAVKKTLKQAKSPLLKRIVTHLPLFDELTALLDRALIDDPPLALQEGGIIREGFHTEVDHLRKICRQGNKWLLEVEREERERTGIKSLKVAYNRVFGYYIEVTKNNLHLVPPEYHRKQTLVNAERFITEKLKKIEEEITGANEKLIRLEYQLFEELRQEVLKYTDSIQQAAQYIAQLDCLRSLGEAALVNRYCRPEIGLDGPIEIKDGRHPVIEKMDLGERFVPNDALLRENRKMLILTGPNMAGKSTYCRSIALICLMAQVGSFVPATSARLPVLERIFARIGASDDLSAGQSTFMVEMNETASILREATPQTLILLDEIGRGTSTYDGMSIARSVLEYIHKYLGSWTLFSTHYHELTVLENELPGIKNYTMAVRERGNRVIFLRKVIPGKADRSYGINVARLAGLPAEVVERAEAILTEIEKADRKGIKQVSLFELDNPARKEEMRGQDDGNHVKLPRSVMKELLEIKLETISPLEAMQELFRIQSALKKNTDGEKS